EELARRFARAERARGARKHAPRRRRRPEEPAAPRDPLRLGRAEELPDHEHARLDARLRILRQRAVDALERRELVLRDQAVVLALAHRELLLADPALALGAAPPRLAQHRREAARVSLGVERVLPRLELVGRQEARALDDPDAERLAPPPLVEPDVTGEP